MRILLAEDDPLLGEGLRAGLRQQGWQVDWVRDGEAAERELGATVESVINGCVYCTSVHAQRFEQLAKRSDVIEQVFADPKAAGTTIA